MIEQVINKIGIGTGKPLEIQFSKRRCLSYLENEDDNGNYIYKYSTIEECKIVPDTPAWITENIRKLKEEKIRISNLNDWFLVHEGGEPIKYVMPTTYLLKF